MAMGIVLMVFGIHAADSIGSDFSRFFTGNPTDKSMWLLLGGVTSLVLGCVLTLEVRSVRLPPEPSDRLSSSGYAQRNQ